MSNILKAINRLEDMRSLRPATPEAVFEAEQALGVCFADDYRAYVLTFGVLSARGVELTGVTDAPRLSVVNVTNRERGLHPDLPAHLYVIENIAMEGVVALQGEDGKVYLLAPNCAPRYCCDSLSAYLKMASER